MLYAEQSADNTGRYSNGRFGRQGWIWNTKTKMVCRKCRCHLVGQGAGRCPKCGAYLVHLSVVPRKGSKKFKKAHGFKQATYYAINYAGDYPTATPRRFPTTGQPPRFNR